MKCWSSVDNVKSFVVQNLVDSGTGSDCICSALFGARKSYHASKITESLRVKEANIRSAINKKMESFEVNKSHMIRDVLEHPFCKVVLDHLVINNDLILEPDLVKSKVDVIMEGWTRKHHVANDILIDWHHQYQSLDYVFDEVFSGIMCPIGFDEFFGVVSDLPDGKAAGLSGISNKLWKHCNKSVLDMLLVILNLCLSDELVPGSWKEAWDMWKAYDSVGWEHLKNNLVRIKMCSRFIHFFGNIYNNRTNQVMIDFGLMNGYHVHDGLDQGEVFSPLLWQIFYDPLLCEIKCQESVCRYRLNSHFISKNGRAKSCAGHSSFFVAGTFVDDMIWVDSSQSATQHIFNIASKFFQINDISINNDKTVVIFINSRISNSSLTISGLPISIAKKGEFYKYLGIFLSTEGLSKPSLARAHSDVCFFTNLVLKKAVSDKQFLYLVLTVLHPILIWFTFFLTASYLWAAFWPALSGFMVEYLCLLFLHTFKKWKKLDPHGLVPNWFDISVAFLVTSRFSPLASAGVGLLDIHSSDDFISGLISFTLVELQAIALALKCMPAAHSVHLFSDSQAALNACRSESDLVLANTASLSGWYFPSCVNEHFLLADGGVVSGNSRHFVCDIFHAVCGVCWKALYHWLPIAVRKRIYDKCYPSVLCLYCGEIEVSDHMFSCVVDDSAHFQVLESCIFSWKVLSGFFLPSLGVLQLLSTCALNFLVFLALYKGFVFNGWLWEAISIFHDPKVAGIRIFDFVRSIYLVFKNDIWLVHAKHYAFMKKNGLIPVNGSIPISVSGLVLKFSAGVIKLLGIAKAFVKSFFEKSFFTIQYDKSKPFFDYEATVGSVIAVMKKATKVFGSEGSFKTVASRKKRKGGVLAESVDNSEVADKALGNCLWGSEAGDTTESESIDMEEECLVEETSVDYGENNAFAEEDPDQMPKSLRVKTKKVLGKPLGVIDYGTVNVDNDVLDGSFLLPPPLPIKLSIQVPVCKSFALDIDLVAVAGKSSQEKLNFVRKIFSGVNGFGGVSASSKFGGIIRASFTSEKMMMAAAQLANDCSVVVNTDLKHPINNHTNRAIVLKEIPVGTSIEAVRAAISEFGLIKSIKMQLVGLWQKAIIKLEDQIQADLLAAKWSVLIGKDAMCVAQANVDKQTWDARDEFRALLYTLLMGTTTHDLWDFIGLVGGKTCVIECSSVSYVRARCATVCFDSEGSLIQAMANTPVIKGIGLRWSCLTVALCSICRNSSYTSLTCRTAGASPSPRSKRAPLSAQDQLCLAKIYEKKSATVSHPLAFGGKPGSPCDKLKDHLKNIKSSLVSLAGQIGELAKRLDSFVLAVSQPSPGCQLLVIPPSQNQGEDIVIGVGSDDATSNKTAVVTGCEIGKHVGRSLCFGHEPIGALEWFGFGRWCSSFTSFSMSGLVWKIATCNVHGLNNPAKQDDVIRWHRNMDNLVSIFTKSKLKEKVRPWLANKFDGVRVFISGLDSGSLGAGVLIVMNSSLARHVFKISEVPGWLLSAGDINSLIAKAVNEFSFVVLGGNFNENSVYKSASFKKCFDLGLVNALGGSVLAKTLTWGNSCSIVKTINYMFVSSSLVNAVVDRGVTGVEDFFDTDHKAVSVSVGLGSLLNSQLNSICKQANKDRWKFDFGNAGKKDDFAASAESLNLDAMWDIVCKVMVFSTVGTFKKKWFKGYNKVFTKSSSRFHKLKLLVSKLVKVSRLLSSKLDVNGVSVVKSLFLLSSSFDRIRLALAKARKSYHSAKLLESKHAEESRIRAAIDRRMESFKSDKGHTIRSVLEHPFHKVVLDHLVVGDELILEPSSVKARTRKHKVVPDISDIWSCQYKPLEYVFDGAFSGVMCPIGFNELFSVVSGLSEGKTAGLSGISNEL
ncbi:hypothetical protein G9A89_020990 [Geosiphon pyriformis]|nr:hypothetical protein G9A89_020990 [Geosiphon pyriformis]